jgi:hypothetical protein
VNPLDLYQRTAALVASRPVALVLIGLVVAFVLIRTSTRLIRARVRWWPGNITVGRVHLHHEFFGVLIMILAGTLAFVVPMTSPWHGVVAFLFGAGVGLVLDEFALLLHLDDVYWTQEGRSSIDAVLVAVALGLMLVLGTAPFGLDDSDPFGPGGRVFAIAFVVVNVGLTVITALKGKLWTALLSVPLWGLGLIGTMRLARPDSPWARRLYSTGTPKFARAERRAKRWERAAEIVVDAIGGRFGDAPDADRRDARSDHTEPN